MQAVPEPAELHPNRVSALRSRIKAVRSVIQLFGVIVCVLVVAQGAACFADYQSVHNIWQCCRWLADSFLYIVVATFGCILEVLVFLPRVKFHLHTFAANRLAAASLYIWIGFFSMGSRIASSEVWETVCRVTGILAWSVGLADIIMSCCSDRSEKLYREDRHRSDRSEKLHREDRHQPPTDDAAVPAATEQPNKDWPSSESQYWLDAIDEGSPESLAPYSLKCKEKAEISFGEPESEQPPMVWATVSRERSDAEREFTFGALVGA